MIAINAIACLVYLLFTWHLLRTCRKYAVFFGYLSFMSAWALLSCFYNDLGIYNLELFRFTEPTYATARLAAFYVVFNLGFLFMARIVDRRRLARVDYAVSGETLNLGHLKLSAYAAIGIIILYFAYTFATEGIPILSGLTRVDYFRQANFLERYLIIYASTIAFVLGYIRRRQGTIAFTGVVFAAFVLFAVLIGNKFSLLFNLLVCFYAPVYVRHLAERPGFSLFTRRRAAGAAVIACALLILAFGSYLYVVRDLSYAYHLLVNRVLAFQGEMWWAVDHDIQQDGRYDRDHWRAELDNILTPGDTREGDVGMKYLMIKVLGPEKAFPIFEGGFLYTQAYPAILTATFPFPVAVCIQFFVGVVYALLLYYLYYTIQYRHLIRAIITMLVLTPYISVLFTGNFGIFLTPGMLVKILLLVILELGIVRARRDTGAVEPPPA